MSRWMTLGVLGAALGVAGLGLVPVAAKAAEKGREHAGLRMRPAAHLGVVLEDVGPDDVSRLKLEAERGALVTGLRPESPAARAGLQEGDVIVRFQGEAVHSVAQLARLVGETPPGRRVTIEVRRDGAGTTLSATLDERHGALARGIPDFELPEPPLTPDAPALADFDWEALAGKARALARSLVETGPPRLGLTFQEVSGQLARYFKLPGEEGLLVTSVEEGGPAQKAGIRAGDAILRVGGRDVRDADALREQVARAESGQDLGVTVQRDGKTLDLAVKVRGESRRRSPPST